MAKHIAPHSERRSHAVYVAAVLSKVAGIKQASSPSLAMACLWLADAYRAQAALWSKAGSKQDQYSEFFKDASTVLNASHAETEVYTAMRDLVGAGIESLHVPIVFPSDVKITRPVDFTKFAGDLIGASTPEAFVAATMDKCEQGGLPDLQKLRTVLLCYFVEVSAKTGDEHLIMAAAMMGGVDLILRDKNDLQSAVPAVFKLLGPVETVRIPPYLRRVGIVR